MAKEQVLDKKTENMLIFAVMLGSFVAVMNSTVINIALPSFMQRFQTDITTVQWLVVGYMLATGLVTPTIGYFGDRYSYRRLFAVGLILLGITSIACAFASNIYVLIFFRILQGIAGGILMPVPMTLVYQFIPAERQLMIVSIVSMASTAGVAFGPSLAGVLIHYLGWQSIFWFNVPVVIIDLILLIRYVPVKVINENQSLDVAGLFTVSFGTIGLLIGFNQGSKLGWNSPLVLAMIIGSILLLVYFVWHELRQDEPMLNFKVFKYPRFIYSFIMTVSTAIATCLAPMFMSLYLQNVMGLEVMPAGLVMLFPSLLMALAAPIAAKLTGKYGSRFVVLFGMIILLWATFELSRFTLVTTILGVSIWLSLRYLGLGLVIPIISNFGMAALPSYMVGHGSAMQSWSRQLISTLSTSIFSVIYSLRILSYTQANAGVELLADQSRWIQCMSINDVNFYSLIILVICVPLIYFFKDEKAFFKKRISPANERV